MSALLEKKFSEYWERKERHRIEQAHKASLRARTKLTGLVETLVHKYGARRIILFGSLARDEFGPHSDIDIAVEGVSKRDYFMALAEICTLMDRWVDLKPIEDLEPRFLQRVIAEGEEIYAS